MDPQLQAVARAICAAEGLDPDALISAPDYAGGVRGDHRHEIPQWETKALEAAKFIMMHRALAHGQTTNEPLHPEASEDLV